ncbi:MAG: hypothetical protein LBE17_14625 [Treponema sp.]|nr:hypothetical protein [Treponema sp.]
MEIRQIVTENLERTGGTQKSPTDPDSRLTAANGKTGYAATYRQRRMPRTNRWWELKSPTKGRAISQIMPMVERGRRHQVLMSGEDFSKSYNKAGLSVKQIRIKGGRRENQAAE